MGGESLGGWVLGALGAFATLAAAGLAIYAQRRDNLSNTVQEQGKDIVHIESHLQDTTGYRPRTK